MKLQGKYYKDGGFWIAEVPFIQLMDQGRTKRECLGMIAASIKDLIGNSGLQLEVDDHGAGVFSLSSPDAQAYAAFILRRLREAHGLTIREVAEALGMKSHTEYARHESGKTGMTIENFNRYVKALTSRDILFEIA
jgi:hypothetical protein